MRTAGDGDAILFWPSLLMTGDMWSAQAEHFAARHRVVLVDPPGHGDSQKLTETFTFDECARTIVDVLDGLGIERAHFVGNSWGGMIGGTFVATPSRPGRQGGADELHSIGRGRTAEARVRLMLRMAKLLGGIRPPLTRSVLKAFLGPTTFRTRPDVVAYVRKTVESADVSTPARGRCAAWCR